MSRKSKLSWNQKRVGNGGSPMGMVKPKFSWEFQAEYFMLGCMVSRRDGSSAVNRKRV